MKRDQNFSATDILISRFRQQYIEGNSEAILQAIKAIIEKEKLINSKLRQELEAVISGRWFINDVKRKAVEELLSLYAPKELASQLEQLVINAPAITIQVNGYYQNKSETVARNLASSFDERRISELYEYLPKLLRGTQQQSYNFANELSKAAIDLKPFLNEIISEILKLQVDEQNSSFLMGFIAGVNDSALTRNAIEQLSSNHNGYLQALRLNHFLKINAEDLTTITNILQSQPKFIAEVNHLNLIYINLGDLETFLKSLISFEPDGAWVAVKIIYDVLQSKNKSWNKLRGIAMLAISTGGLIKADLNVLINQAYDYVLLKLLSKKTDLKFVEFLTFEILQASTSSFLNMDFTIQETLFHLLTYKWEIAWPIIGNFLLTSERAYNLLDMLRYYRNFKTKNLRQWIIDNGPGAAIYVANFAPLEITIKDKTKLSPIITAILKDFSDDSQVLSEVSARLHSFSSSGSAIPIFESRIELLRPLQNSRIKTLKIFVKRELQLFSQSIQRESTHLENWDLGEY